MSFCLRIARGIDSVSEALGKVIGWMTLAMILIGAYNAVVRYAGRFIGWKLSSNAYIELQWYLFSLIFLFGASYALRRDAHVRVDVLYGRLSARGKAWINTIGTVVFLLPCSVLILWLSWPSIRNSWTVMEQSPDPGGLPRYPIKTAIMIAFAMLILQGIAELIRNLAILVRGEEAARPGAEEPGAKEAHHG